MSDDLVKKWRALQEKVKRYEKLSKSTTSKRPAKQKTYEKEWKQAVADLAKLEKKIMIEGRKLQRQKQLEAKKEIEKSKKVKNEVKKEVQKKEPKKLVDVYCGAKQPGKGKRMGTEEECRTKGQIRLYGRQKIADKSGGNIDKQLVNQLLNASVKKRPAVRKGGSLPANMIKKLIVASHEKDFKDVGDYKIDRQLSHEWVHVYYNDQKKHCVIVHRGSADAYDAFIDLQLLVQHKSNKRFKISEQVQKKAEKKYKAKGYFITTLGSSLGAYLSEEYGQNSDEVITVSKPTTPGDLLTGRKKGKDQYDIRSTRDPIAILQNFQKGKHDIVIPSQSWNPYKEHIGDLVSGRLLPEDKLIGKEMTGQGFAELLSRIRLLQLKQLLKLLRGMKRGRARQYPITQKKKQELLDMILELSDDMRGGKKLTNKKKQLLQTSLNALMPQPMGVPVYQYLSTHLK